jgi:hypothetical protein
MLISTFSSIACFDYGSEYNYVLKSKDQTGWWNSMKKECHAIETKGVWENTLMSKMPPGRKTVGNGWVYTEKDD